MLARMCDGLGLHRPEISSSCPQERVNQLGDDWKFEVGVFLRTLLSDKVRCHTQVASQTHH